MKKSIKLIVLLLALTILTVGQAFAYPVSVTDEIVMSTSDVGGTGNYGVRLADDSEVLFRTFCVEKDVYFTPGKVYSIASIENYVDRPNGIDRYLNDGTKYLYWHFDQGTLSDMAGGYSNNNSGLTALQYAIWSLEGYDVELSGLSEILYGLALDNSDEGAAYNVKVMNIMSGNTYAQSQLIAAPVPEPATMVLLGSGLVGLAFYRRRMKK